MKTHYLNRNAFLKRIVFFVFFFAFLGAPLHAQKWLDMMHDESVNFYDVQREAENHFQLNGTGRGSGYKLYKRWEYETQFEIDVNGNRKKAIDIVEEFKSYKQKREASKEFAIGSAGDNWVEMGPTYWSRTSGWNPGVGRIKCVSVDPKNNNVIYVASPGGGAWKTTNGGTSWSPLTDRLPGMVMYSVGIDPVNTNTVFFGTEGIGIYKSTNGGSTMTTVNSGYSTSSTTNKIIVNPNNTNIVLVASSAGIYRSTNGGVNWARVSTGGFNDIEFKPNDPNTVYASGNSFFKSTDGGASFAQISNGISGSGRSFIAVTPANANYVYMLQARGNEFGALYRSTDAGSSFTTRVTGSPAAATNYFGYSPAGTDAGGQAFHDMALCVSPSNTEEVHIAGIICWKSTNGGSSFVSTTEWAYPNNRGYNHADVHALEYVGSTIYSGSDGGIFKSTDRADNWTDLSKGLGIRQFYKIANALSDATMVGGGAQDNGHSIIRNGNWIDWLGADGMDVMIDHKNANIVYACTQNGGLNKSTNGGQSRGSINSPPGSGNWVTPLAMDPVNPAIIYIGYAELYKSTNSGSSWSAISSFGGTSGLDNVTVAPSNGNYIYASKGNTLYVTKNGGGSWSNITSGLSGRITGITVHDSSPDKVAVSTSNGTAKVYKSTNAGASWTNFQKSLPNLSANTIVFQSGSEEGMYVGMDVGIYYIDNNMGAWIPFMTNVPNVKVYELEVHQPSKKIRAATHGRGLWESPLYKPVQGNQPPVVSITAPANNASYTSPATINVTANASDPDGNIVSVEFYDGATLLFTDNSSPYSYSWTNAGLGTHTITAKAKDNGGAVTTSSSITVVMTKPVTCDPPTNLAISSLTSTSVTLSWTGASSALSYVVWHRKSSDAWTLNQTVTGTSVTLTGLTPNTDYQWTLLANCDGLNSGFVSPYPTFKTLAPANQLPVVSITSPANNSSYTAPASITINASASDADGTVSKVEFYNGSTLLGTDVSSPYSFAWTNVGVGTYSITARATDNSGGVKNSSAVAINVNSPTGGVVTLMQHCSEPFGYIVGLNVGSYTTEQLTVLGALNNDVSRITVQAGYQITVYSENNFTGNSLTYTADQGCLTSTNFNDLISSVVVSLIPVNQLPVVSITAPSNNATYTSPATINLTATASDPDGSIVSVEFYDGTTLLFTDNSSPYSYSWTSATVGTHAITAKAKDNQGAVTTSAVVSITVNAPVNQLPVVSITSPANNATYTSPATINFTATASDADGTVSKVEFYNGSTLLGTDVSSPYSFAWTNVGVGTYSITARATDNSGGIKNSSAVTINVNSPTGGVVTLMQHCSEPFGYIVGLNVGSYTTEQLTVLGALNNDVSRITVQAGYQVTVYSENNFTGNSLTYTSDQACLTSTNFNDLISSVVVSLIPVNQLPVVSITAPSNNATYTSPATINLTASASDSDGSIVSVEFYDGTTLLFTDNSSPYSYAWTNASIATHSITAKAKDNQGAVTTSAVVTVLVNNPVVTCNAPTNLVVSNLTSTSATLSWTGSSSSLNYVVWHRKTSDAWSLNQTVTGTSVTLTGLTPNTDYQWTLLANCDGLNSGFVSPYPVFKTLAVVNQLPSVSLTSPANNSTSTAPATISIAANASDVDGTVTKVDFYSGTTLIGTDASSPYSFTWSNVVAGTYSITARATDNSGATMTSAAISITVNAVVSNLCNGLPTYVENAGYVPGSVVKSGLNRYECKPWPYSGWCNGATWAYEPGVGLYWQDAWTVLGSCTPAARASDNNNLADEMVLNAMPNPFKGITTIALNVVDAGEVSVKVIDKTGLVVETLVQKYLPAGDYTYQFDGSTLPSGLYLIKYSTNNTVKVHKVIKTE